MLAMRCSKLTLVPLILLLLFPAFIHSQEAEDLSGGSAGSAHPYPNSADGLRLLLQDVLAAARDHNRPKLESFVSRMEIPDYEEWFTMTFGQEVAGSWAGPYGRGLSKNEMAFQSMFMQFANQDGEISTRDVNDAPDPQRGIESGMTNALQRPVDIFFASWKKRESTPDSGGDPIGYFMSIEGQFRWLSVISFPKIRPAPAPGSTANGAGMADGPFHAGTAGVGYPTCTYCPDPGYSEEARAKHLEGTVVLQAIVQPDGRASDIKVLKTFDVTLAQMAVDAVQRWRFKPARDREGQPVAVIVPIEVTFRLLK
jgi:TonB family protein